MSCQHCQLTCVSPGVTMFSQVRIQQRYLLCLLIFTGLVTNYMLRINMSIAIVTMAGGDNSTQSPCADPDNGTDSGGGSEDTDSLGWTGSEVSWVLTAFFIGYAFFQMLGGFLAEIFGTKLVFGLSQLGGSVEDASAKFRIWKYFRCCCARPRDTSPCQAECVDCICR